MCVLCCLSNVYMCVLGCLSNVYMCVLGCLSNVYMCVLGFKSSVVTVAYCHFTFPQNQHDNHQPSVPTTIEEVHQINPFMRVNEPAVQKHCGKDDPIEVMQFLRNEKDSFK